LGSRRLFFVPIIGEIVYLMFYFSTKAVWNPEIGDVVTNPRVLSSRDSRYTIPKNSKMKVVEVLEGSLLVPSPDGLDAQVPRR
jgi:hypothetical protein